MKRILFIVVLLACLNPGFGQQKFLGQFQHVSEDYNSDETIYIKSDGSFVINLRAHFIKHFGYGKWTSKGDTILLNVDSAKTLPLGEPDSLSKYYDVGLYRFVMKEGSFYKVSMTKEQYLKVKQFYEEYNKQTGEHNEMLPFESYNSDKYIKLNKDQELKLD